MGGTTCTRRTAPKLHPLRWSYVRDTVVRALTPGSPPVRAIVVERFAVDGSRPMRQVVVLPR